MGREFLAGPAVRVREDQEHPPASVILKGNRPAAKVGQAERRGDGTRLEAVPLDAALGQRALAGEPDPLGSVADDPASQGQDLVAAHRHGLGHLPLLIQQVRDRRALVLESLPSQRAVVRHQQDGACQPMLKGELTVRLGVLRAGEHQLHVAGAQIGLELRQVRGEKLAERAIGIPVDQQHPLAAEIVQGDQPPVRVGQAW